MIDRTMRLPPSSRPPRRSRSASAALANPSASAVTRRGPLVRVIAALSLVAMVALASPLLAADSARLVRVALDHGLTAQALAEAGLDVVSVHSGACMLLVQDSDAAVLARLGATPELIDAAPGATAARRTRAELAQRAPVQGRRVRSAAQPDGIVRTEVLPPFGSGSLGGYWTLAEVKMKLDDLVASDTQNLVADKIDTIGTTIQGRKVWALEIDKHWPGPGPDPRPVSYMSALTHAREPEGMQALLYWVDRLLATYGVDPLSTELLDHRRIVICPVVNPDGYKRNEDTYVGTAAFGFWRKNLRDNDLNSVINGNDGVDLNRNYSFQWGLNSGSSGAINSETYRGTASFSEPETQIQRDLVNALKPKTGLSFHTYGDWHLNVWGYTAAAPPDSAWFYRWNDDATRDNGYQSGQSTRVLYAVSGEYNDWVYGDTLLKPRGFTWTPEVGTDDDGFWPPPSRIEPLAAENVWRCSYTAAIAGPYLRIESSTLAPQYLNAGYFATLALTATNNGLTTSGPGVVATLAPLSAGAQVLQNTVNFPEAQARSTVVPADSGGRFTIAADDTVTPGRLLSFEVTFTLGGGESMRDTLTLACGTPTVLLLDDASAGLTGWTSSGWGVETSADPTHPGPNFNDSPNLLYPTNMNRAFQRTAPISLAGAGVHGYLTYSARWDFEAKYDGAVLELSPNASTWTATASTGTNPSKGQSGSPISVAGVPTYIGSRHTWRSDRVDLSSIAGPGGTPRYFRFRSMSDAGLEFDGLSVDDVRVVLYDPAVQPAPTAVGGPLAPVLSFSAPSPNPARQNARFEFALPHAGTVRLEVLDVQGRHIATLANGRYAAEHYVRGWDLSDDAGHRVPTGVYLARLVTEYGVRTQRLVVMQ